MQIADLSLPVSLCEPVSDMGRRGDFLEYVELLHEVCTKNLQSTLRMLCAVYGEPGVPACSDVLRMLWHSTA